MNSTYMQLRNNLNYLKLNQMNENLDEVLDDITKNNLSFTDGLIKLTQIEIDHRKDAFGCKHRHSLCKT